MTSKYLKMESEIIADTNGHFNLSNCNVKKVWYTLKNNKIEQFNNLAQAMLIIPEFVIFDRYDNTRPRFNYTTLYFDRSMNLVAYIDFNGWKLGDVDFDNYDNRNTFVLIDPKGIRRKVKLSRYFPYLCDKLNDYIGFDSFEAYDNKDSD